MKDRNEQTVTDGFPSGYAVLIGVGRCAYAPWSLPATVNDVRALAATLTDPTAGGYPDNENHLRLLYDESATGQAILDSLAWLGKQTASTNATALVYFSGHGWLGPNGRDYYLIPHDAEPRRLLSSALPAAHFVDAIQALRPQRLLVLMDCCHAGGMATARTKAVAARFTPAALPKALVTELGKGAGRAVFASAREEEQSYILPDGSLSIFTHHLLEALHGAACQPGDTTVRLSHLMRHLGRAVPETALQLYHASQTPYFDVMSEDYPVCALGGGKGIGAGQPAGMAPIAKSTPAVRGRRNIVSAGPMSGNVVVSGDHSNLIIGQD